MITLAPLRCMPRRSGRPAPLTWEGASHTAYGQTECITRMVDDYLVSLVVPAPGTRCPA